ncbi:MAG: hemerythrin domain-containing protein [Adhaeribacter sp.]
MDRKPLKRSEHIVILSREHHTGLLFCWKIRQGLRKEVDTKRIRAYVPYFWENHLRQHFQEEEEQLFLKVNDALCQKALQQHQEIKSLIEQVIQSTPAPTPNLLNQLADYVDAHIRFEERELFPHLEKVLNPQELKNIGAALEQSHATPVTDNFPDAFWTR